MPAVTCRSGQSPPGSWHPHRPFLLSLAVHVPLVWPLGSFCMRPGHLFLPLSTLGALSGPEALGPVRQVDLLEEIPEHGFASLHLTHGTLHILTSSSQPGGENNSGFGSSEGDLVPQWLPLPVTKLTACLLGDKRSWSR